MLAFWWEARYLSAVSNAESNMGTAVIRNSIAVSDRPARRVLRSRLLRGLLLCGLFLTAVPAAAIAQTENEPAGEAPAATTTETPPVTPAASQPVASQPVASQPVASQPVASQPAASQPAASQPGAADENDAAETEPLPTPPSDAATTPEPPAVVERFVYIPYEKLSEVYGNVRSKVVISLEQYQDLVKRAAAQGADVKPLSGVVLTQARYTAEVVGETVQVLAEFDCRALQPGWSELPVQFGQAAVGELTTDGSQNVLLRGTGEGRYALIFEKPGAVQVKLKLLVPVKSSPAGPSMEFLVPPVGITTLDFTVPKPDYEITVTPRNIPLKLPEAAAGESPASEANANENSNENSNENGNENENENAAPAAVTAEVTRRLVSLGATEKIGVSWVPRTSDRPQMDLLTTVSNRQKVTLRDGLIHTEAVLEYRILRGELTALRVAVPKGQRVLDVTSSARIQGWNLAEEDQRQIIDVQLLGAAKENLTLEVNTEQALTAEQIAIGGMQPDGRTNGIHALDVTREQGTLQLQHGEELTLTILKQTGLVRTETSGQAGEQLTFRYFTPAFEFAVRAEPVQAVLDVNHEAYFLIREQRIETETRLNYTVSRAGIFHLELELPEGMTLLGVECPAMAEFQHDQPQRRLTVMLKERTQGSFTVRLRGHYPLPDLEAGGQTRTLAALPLCQPRGVRQEEGRIGVWTIEAIELVTEEGQIEGAQSLPVNELAIQFPETVLRAAWKFQSRPVVIPVRLLRRPTRMTTETATRIQVEPSGVNVETLVTYQVQYAGIDQFRIAVPKAVSDRVQIEVAGPGNIPILQKSPESARPTDAAEGGPADPAAGKAQPEMIVWLIQTQRPVAGRQQFKVTYDLPFQQTAVGSTAVDSSAEPQATEAGGAGVEPAGKNSAGPQRTVQSIPIVQPRGLDANSASGPALIRASGEMLIQAEAALAVAIAATGRSVESIDLRELRLLPQSGQQAYRYAVQSENDPAQLELTISRYEVEAVVSTVVTRMLTELVLGISQDLAVRTRMKVLSSQRQRLVLQLPEAVQPMLVMVNQETRQLQKGEPSGRPGWTNYFINVSRSGDSSQEFLITVQYLRKMQPISEYAPRGSLQFDLPVLLATVGNPAVVQQSRCQVWLPEKIVPVLVEAPFQRVEKQTRISFSGGIQPDNGRVPPADQWLRRSLATGLDFPTEGHVYLFDATGGSDQLELTYWNRVNVSIALSLALLVIGFILMRTGWENKILISILTLTLLAVLMQYEPAIVKQGLHSARIGLIALLAIWVTHGVAGLFREPQLSETPSRTTDADAEVAETSGEEPVPVDAERPLSDPSTSAAPPATAEPDPSHSDDPNRQDETGQ